MKCGLRFDYGAYAAGASTDAIVIAAFDACDAINRICDNPKPRQSCFPSIVTTDRYALSLSGCPIDVHLTIRGLSGVPRAVSSDMNIPTLGSWTIRHDGFREDRG